MNDFQRWRELGQQLRVDSIRCSATTRSGHPTSGMSAADLMAVLLDKYFRYDVRVPDNPNNDCLIFSKGHASPLLYALYKAAGAISDEELLSFRTFGSRLEGHPTPVLPWVDVATGSLGQGLPIGVGLAPAGKRLDRLPYRVWVLCGDSEMSEGSMSEAFEHASFYGLDNLTAIVDVNRLGQRGETMHGWDLDSYASRAEAFGWHAIAIDGHDVEQIDRAYAEALETTGRPTALIARTVKGKGVAAVEDQPTSHGKALDGAEAAVAELGGTRDIRVEVMRPVDTTRHMSSRPVPSSCPATTSAPRWRRGRPTARPSPPSAPRAATSSRSTARCRTRHTRRSSPRRTRSGTSRCTSRSSRWSPPPWGSRCAAGSRSPRASPAS